MEVKKPQPKFGVNTDLSIDDLPWPVAHHIKLLESHLEAQIEGLNSIIDYLAHELGRYLPEHPQVIVDQYFKTLAQETYSPSPELLETLRDTVTVADTQLWDDESPMHLSPITLVGKSDYAPEDHFLFASFSE